MYHIGLDIGSTTIKAVVTDHTGAMLFFRYERHNAHISGSLKMMLSDICGKLGTAKAALCVTGSVGMGIAEKYGLNFVQEVIAATTYVNRMHNGIETLIDIGGEDAKIVFFRNGETTDLRMNGNCAGGTGAFIDQMAILLGVSTDELSRLAMQAKHIHPIASRCGVFGKTDVQNLIARNVCKEEIAASIFHAVAVQVVVTLAHGCQIGTPVLLCGGPFTFLPALRQAFNTYLHWSENEAFLPENSHLLPAWGAALMVDNSETVNLNSLIDRLENSAAQEFSCTRLEALFRDAEEYNNWKSHISRSSSIRKESGEKREEVTLGIDSGSATTKIVALNNRNELIYSYYQNNNGDPVTAVRKGLSQFMEECAIAGTEMIITGSCATGYGEDLIKSTFHLDTGIIETIAHYTAAHHVIPEVSFILDIGGQDMKAVFVSGGVINRIEINEACSSGCGSFIETFARSLGYSVTDFAKAACRSGHPYDLGTRCTVFMNSKVKQALREGCAIEDISAGLSYSVIRNCLYKVLKIKDVNCLGEHIVVQGGTMKNDAVVRAFEKLTGKQVFRSDYPELMGAMGCALYARQYHTSSVPLNEMLENASFTTEQKQCHGCENQCKITVYRFSGGNRYYSGNRCERFFSNNGADRQAGINVYARKYSLLFDSIVPAERSEMTIGIPRCLNMYEEFPFWHALFVNAGFRVQLSSPSSFKTYEEEARKVMSDNICFPAKLVHSHIQNLAAKQVDRIFMPFVVFERKDGGVNSYNCPIVSGYSEVVKGTATTDIPIDSPAVTFKDKTLLYKQCRKYLCGLGVAGAVAKRAFKAACDAEKDFGQQIANINRQVIAQGWTESKLTVLLAGRPYHSDPLIQHKVADMIASMGVNVITDDIVRDMDVPMNDVHFVRQWAYANRILKAAKWVALQGQEIQFMQMTSFGCGPDTFLTDEVECLLQRYGKTPTFLKIDDVCHIGSLKLRVRSAIESLKMSVLEKAQAEVAPFVTTPPYTKADRKRKIIAPFFTSFISPLIPSLMHVAGYEVEILPVSDTESCTWGLRYANNEVCYPATLIVGDIIKAFKEGKYDPKETAVAITQTGGQCRASSYISLIKKALIEAGFQDIPVLSLTFGLPPVGNQQSGFRINWLKMLPIVVDSLLYSDCISKFYYASVVRERGKGQARQLKDTYLNMAKDIIRRDSLKELQTCLALAAKDFNHIIRDAECPRVGVVGEIFLKFNPFAQHDICEWLSEKGIEVVPPLLTEFFTQEFVNYEVKQNSGIKHRIIPDSLIHKLYALVWRRVERFNRIAGTFRYFTPFESVFNKANQAEKVISLNAQFGEGWMLPAEILSLASQNVRHVISMQPFGCIANHIVSKGIENRIKRLYPDIHLLSLDFDSGVSEVNVVNRLLLFIDNLKRDNSQCPPPM